MPRKGRPKARKARKAIKKAAARKMPARRTSRRY